MIATVERVAFTDVEVEDGVEVELYGGTVWGLRCPQHGTVWHCDYERQARNLARDTVSFCRDCAEEVRRESFSLIPTDLDADRVMELREQRRIEENEALYDEDGIAR